MGGDKGRGQRSGGGGLSATEAGQLFGKGVKSKDAVLFKRDRKEDDQEYKHSL